MDAVFIDDANAALRRMRNVHGATLPDANRKPTRGIFEAHLEQLGGGYGTCLPDSAGDCGLQVSICSAAGLIEISFKSGGVAAPRVYSYANLISDVPVTCR